MNRLKDFGALFTPSGIRRWYRRRWLRYGMNAVILSFIVLGLLVLVGFVTVHHPRMLDVTLTKRYSLSAPTIKLLESLTKDVTVYGFLQREHPGRGLLRDVLMLYAYQSPRFSYEFVDPDRQPGIAKNYGVTMYGTVVVVCGDKRELVFGFEEEKITNAIVRVTREGKKVIYFLSGHGEKGIRDPGARGFTAAKSAILDLNYEVNALELMREDEVPQDAAVLIIPGPEADLLPEELDRISSYIDRGGRVFLMIDPSGPPGLERFLAQYGIELGDNVILDPQSRIFGADFFIPVVTEYERHTITKELNAFSSFPLARTVTFGTPLPDNIRVSALAQSSDGSWAEKDVEALFAEGKAQFDEGRDVKGPVSLAVVATVHLPPEAPEEPAEEEEVPEDRGGSSRQGRRAQIVVFGDSEFADNSHINLGGNGNLFLNVVNWLAEEEDLINIRPKDAAGTPVFLTEAQGKLVRIVSIFVLPIAVFVIGVVVIWRRRGPR